MVWGFLADGMVAWRCAHCPHIGQRLDIGATYDEALIQRQVASSKAGHERACSQRRNRKW
jgi:hypothetical protein